MAGSPRRVLQSLIAALAIVSGGCERAGGSAPAPHVLRIADWSEPASLDPLLAHDQDTIGFDLLFVQTLVGLSYDNRLVPILVTRVPSRANGDVSADGRTIVYHLRPGVRFADGTPLTARDVVFTFHAIVDPRNPILSEDAYRRVAALTAPDANTVVVHLRAPWNAAVRELFAQSDFAFGILPAHAFNGTALQGAGWEDHAFGSGPFRVTEWKRGDRIVLERNPYFHPRPKLDRIELRIIPDLNAVVVALRSGEADLARLTAVPARQAASVPGISIAQTPINGTDYLSLQAQAPPTNDVHVRRAIADALDTATLAKAFRGYYVAAGAFLPPVLAWHDPALAPIRQSQAAARAELDAGGWRLQAETRSKNGEPLTVVLVSQAGFAGEFTAIVQRELADVGIRAELKRFPATLFNGPNGPLRSGRFNVAAHGWIGGADPEQSVTFACDQIGPNGDNVSRFCDPAFDAAFRDQAVTPDDRRRRSDFLTMQRIVYDRLPVVPLDYTQYFDAVNRRVTGFARNMLGFPVNAEQWDAR
jgi:peptide/nickel transport system substrate-binding protein